MKRLSSHIGSFQLKHLFVAAAALILLCCSTVSVVLLWDNFAYYKRMNSESAELVRYKHVLAMYNSIAAERGPANNAMTGVDSSLATKLAESRSRTDEAFAAMALAFDPEIHASQADFTAYALLNAHLRSARAHVDRVAASSPEARTPETIKNAITAMFQAADAAKSFRDRMGHKLSLDSAEMHTAFDLVNRATALRDRGGRLGSYVVMMLAGNWTGNDHLAVEMGATSARVDELWSSLQGSPAVLSNSDEVRRALERTNNQYFIKTLSYVREVVKRHKNGETTNPQQFTVRYVDGMGNLQGLYETILKSTVELSKQRLSHALWLVAVGVTGVIIIVVLLALFIFATQKFLFKPLLNAHAQILALARDDDRQFDRNSSLGKEIREIFTGLVVLRGHLLEKRNLVIEQRRLSEKLKTLAQRDPLTGLFNRRAAEEIASECVAEADRSNRPLGIIMVDLDHFKRINDTYGHPAGDLVLQATAKEMAKLLRASDTVARIGGEEILVILDVQHGDRAAEIAERLRSGLAGMEIAAHPEIKVTASLGVAIRRPRSGVSWPDLVATADRRLYQAKSRGRNRVVAFDKGTTSFMVSAS